jgi:hypothetical protein
MEETIKELRVQIDELAQLTKNLKEEVIVLDLSTIPKDQTVEDYIEDYKNGLIIKNSTNTFNKRSKEIEKTVDNLYLAKAWLGKVLGELGTSNPYGSGYKTKEDIVPTQDVSNLNGGATKHNFNMFKSHIEKVDWLRQEIQKLDKSTDPYINQDNLIEKGFSVKAMAYLFNCNKHLSEAKFWLGFELERIKNEK